MAKSKTGLNKSNSLLFGLEKATAIGYRGSSIRQSQVYASFLLQNFCFCNMKKFLIRFDLVVWASADYQLECLFRKRELINSNYSI